MLYPVFKVSLLLNESSVFLLDDNLLPMLLFLGWSASLIGEENQILTVTAQM